MYRKLAKRIFLLTACCPKCNIPYREDRVHITGSPPPKVHLHFVALCGGCSKTHIYDLPSEEQMSQYIGDLTLKEWGEPRFDTPVTSDQVLDLMKISAIRLEEELVRAGIFKADWLATEI